MYKLYNNFLRSSTFNAKRIKLIEKRIGGTLQNKEREREKIHFHTYTHTSKRIYI